MKIKKLEMLGFKSFVDRTVVHFDHDVTGIVGPNGCGKSNVVDAIKWVQGEQSAKMLRGGSMHDVIFNGSEVRGPAQFAEVSLTFDNTDGLAPPEYREYAEITVSRRLDRQGRSDYYINKTPVRLMDITNLFLGTGVGRRAYSIIEQGRIGYIVTSKPEDRRQIIEEAAGVTKYKARKKAAEKKMEQTRDNLTRVSDIINELEKDLASLKRQAQKAERYKQYRAEQRDLELYVGAFRYLELFTTKSAVVRMLEEEQAVVDGVRMALRIREAETEAERLAVEKASIDVNRAQQVSYALNNEVRMLEAQIKQQEERLAGLVEREGAIERELAGIGGQRGQLEAERRELERALDGIEEQEAEAADVLERENEALSRRKMAVEEAQRAVVAARNKVGDAQKRIVGAEGKLSGYVRRREDALSRLEKLRAEREDLAAKLLDVEQDRMELEARFEGLRSGRAASAERKAQCEEELQRFRAEIVEVDKVVDSLRDEVAQKRSRLRSLEQLQQRFEGVGAGVRTLMTKYADSADARRAKGFVGLVADRFDVSPEHTRALAGALGERLQFIVVDQLESGLDALGYLRREAKGRASLVPRRHAEPHRPRAVPATGDGVVGRLADLVRSAPEDAELRERLLGDVLVVDTLETAIRLARGGYDELTFVTVSGEVLEGDGTVTGGQADDSGAHMLEMKREMRELEGVVADLGSRFDTALARQGELRAFIAERQAELEAAKNEAHSAELALVGAEKDLRRVESEGERMRSRTEDLAGEIEDLSYELEQAGGEESEARRLIDDARNEEVAAEEELASHERVLEERRDAVDMQSERVTEVRLMATQARERAQSDRNALERVQRAARELGERENRLRGEVSACVHNQGRIRGEVYVQREMLHEQVSAAMHAESVLAEFQTAYDAARVAAGHHEGELKSLRTEVEDRSGKVSQLSLRERELSMAIEHLIEGVREKHELDIRRILTDYHVREIPDAAVLQRIDELGKLIQRMGDINLLAIEEYDEKSKRFEYLDAQRKDLLDALAQLERAIRQMNKESRQLFKEAFDAIDQRFRLIFPKLFRGGEARLQLSNPEDLLESGVEIVAQPPGKKLGSLELMSGGEKALTAVALIFAIFQYKPSPFCILDEVDAPLDEANITRFAEAVRQMTDRSQFIVITHSKRTMETADVLYGVTMEQPGISKLVAVELRGERRPVQDERTIAA